MLKQRVITALVMLAILVPAIFYKTPLPFDLIVQLLIGAAAWEWGRLNGLEQPGSFALAAICVMACGMSWYGGLLERQLFVLWVAAAAAWVLTGSWLLRNGVDGWQRIPKMLRLTGGLVALWLVWLAVAQARMIGISFLMSVLLLVWVADIFAYFAGRTFGGRFSKGKLGGGVGRHGGGSGAGAGLGFSGWRNTLQPSGRAPWHRGDAAGCRLSGGYERGGRPG